MKLPGHAPEICGDDSRVEGNGEADRRDHERAPPLLCLRPVLRVLGVIDGEGDKLVLLELAIERRLVRLGDGAGGCLLAIFVQIGLIGELTGGEDEVFFCWIDKAGAMGQSFCSASHQKQSVRRSNGANKHTDDLLSC